jgi:hypothetical protein
MTNHTDSSKEIEIPQKLQNWMAQQIKEFAGGTVEGRSFMTAAFILLYRHLRPSPSPQKFFFSQDDSCHWYMIPVERREEWEKARDLNLDRDEGYDEWQKGNWEDYMTGGGIDDIEFTPTTSGNKGI